jgi:serine/threonine protein kinase
LKVEKISSEMEQYFKKVISGEIQDEENVEKASFEFTREVLKSLQQPQDILVIQAQQAMQRCLQFPEFKSCSFISQTEGISTVFARAQIADLEEEIPLLLSLVLRAFTFHPLMKFKQELIMLLAMHGLSSKASITLFRLSLEALRIILDLTATNSSSPVACKALLTQKLLPLHLIQGKISPTQSLLGGFHRELTLCTSKCCEIANKPEVLEEVICELCGPKYPQVSEGNSPKEVLFLHEIERLITDTKLILTGKARAAVASRLLSAVGSLHAAVCERALSFWKSDQVLKVLQGSDQLLSKTCDRALAKTSLDHWSSTVKSMAGAALLRSSTLFSSSASSAQIASDPVMSQAVQKAKENQEKLLNPPHIPTMPMPKSFSSTSVIRDATEPFAIGAFGVMWKGRAIVPGASKNQWPLVALKELEDVASAKAEIDAMTRIGPHPTLVQLLGVFELRKGTAMSLVLEFIDGPGDLHTAVIERGSLPVNLCRFYAGEIGAGLKHIHSKGFVYGDMKPENVLITLDGHCKICDFGSAFPLEDTKTKTVGTVEYMPPEQVSSIHGDWWAFGCVIHFMITGRPPVFFDNENDSDLSSAFSRAVTFADQKGGIFIKDNAARTLVAQLCTRNPSERPADGGESNAFFTEVKPWNSLSLRKDPPKLPAEKFSKAQLERNGGPWQRRTFSTIHSPLPTAYSIDSGFVSLCVGGTTSIKDFTLPMDWTVIDPRLTVLFENTLSTIPKTRTPAPVTAQNNGGETKKVRRAVQSNYTVAGVDLKAG